MLVSIPSSGRLSFDTLYVVSGGRVPSTSALTILSMYTIHVLDIYRVIFKWFFFMRIGNLYQVMMNIAVSVYTCTLPAGALYVPAGPKEFVSGDRVKCDLDMEVLSIASAIGEGADDHIAMVRCCYIVYVISLC